MSARKRQIAAMVMDNVEEEDARLGVVGRGRKIDRWADALAAAGVYLVTAETLTPSVHAWFCGVGVNHGDKNRPQSGWVCQRAAAAILAALPETAIDPHSDKETP